MHELDSFFNPRGIALVGASADPAKPGNALLRRIIEMGYRGNIYPVNPREKEILNLRCYPSVSEIDEPVDLVILLLPSHLAVEAAKDVARRVSEKGDAKAVICVSGGFRELGTEEAAARERLLVETLRNAGARLIGPNCLGIIDTNSRVTTNFDVGDYRAGGLSIITQSGALATSLLFWARTFKKIGLAKFVSLGNMADVNVVEVLSYLGEDDHTRVIAIYLEGFDDPRRLFQVAKQVSKRKPIVMLKSGRSELGSSAAKSHTGALTGPDQLYTAACRQTGVIRADTLLDFYELLHTLEKQPVPRGNRVFVLTHIGGPGTLCLDEIGRTEELEMAIISEEAKRDIGRIIAPTATLCRPEGYIDVTASHNEEMHNKILKILFKEPTVDAVIQILAPSRFLSEKLMAEKVVDAYNSVGKESGKTFLNVITYSEAAGECKLLMEENSLPTFDTPETAVRVLAKAVNYRKKREKLDRCPDVYPVTTKDALSSFGEKARREGRSHLLEVEAYELLNKIGIEYPRYRILNDVDELDSVFNLSFPVVVKVVSPDVIHKSDVGGVVTGVSNVDELKAAMETIRRNIKGARIEGFLVQEMISSKVELNVGALRDSYFGPVVAFGLGGIFVEAFRDVAFRLAPLGVDDALEMIRETKAHGILKSRRAGLEITETAIAELIIKVSNLIAEETWIKEIDLNPVMPYKNKLLAVDARIIT